MMTRHKSEDDEAVSLASLTPDEALRALLKISPDDADDVRREAAEKSQDAHDDPAEA